MFRRVAKSVSIAVKAAVISFEKSYQKDEDLDSILGYRDSLTEIPNRKAFERDREKIDRASALVMIDIDRFKTINDTKGHQYGDIVLKRLAKVLQENVCPEGTPYRLGGDEFALLVPKTKVNAICRAIRSNIRKEDSFTISQGIVFDLGPEINDREIDLADRALYQSKRMGRDSISSCPSPPA